MSFKSEPGLGEIFIELFQWSKRKLCWSLWQLELFKRYLHNKRKIEEDDELEEDNDELDENEKPTRISFFGREVEIKDGDYQIKLPWDVAIQKIVSSMPKLNQFHREEDIENALCDIMCENSDVITEYIQPLDFGKSEHYGINFRNGIKPVKILECIDKYIVVLEISMDDNKYYHKIDVPLNDWCANTMIKHGIKHLKIELINTKFEPCNDYIQGPN